MNVRDTQGARWKRVACAGAGLVLAAAGAASAAPTIEGCPVFPSDHIWNTPVDGLPADPQSDAYVQTIGRTASLHADFGSGLWDGGPIGIPYNVVPGSQARVPVSFEYADESDPGPYPIPPGALREWGSDHHILILDRDNGRLYELYAAERRPGGRWRAGSGAIFDLRGYTLRPAGWTSADAAGLPILPGLVRYEEAAAGEIRHALRFTAPQTRRACVWPARHVASSLSDLRYPPMGQRFRLKAGFDIAPFPPEVQAILRALKTYGMMLADNGAAWYLSGAPNESWDNDALHRLHDVTGAEFEAVDVSSLMQDPDSGRVLQPFLVHPEIRANGAAGRIAIAPSQTLSITVSLPDGGASGVNADWWLVAVTPAGYYYYVYPDLWLAAPDETSIRPGAQGALCDIAPTEVLAVSGLLPGAYEVYFGVDPVMNGALDYDSLRYAVVDVQVE